MYTSEGVYTGVYEVKYCSDIFTRNRGSVDEDIDFQDDCYKFGSANDDECLALYFDCESTRDFERETARDSALVCKLVNPLRVPFLRSCGA